MRTLLVRLFGTRLLHLVLGFALTTTIAASIDRSDAGEYFYFVSVGLLIGTTLFGWIQTVYFRFSYGADSRPDLDKIKSISKFSLVAVALISGLVGSVAFLLSSVDAQLGMFQDPLDYLIVAAIVVLTGVNASLLGLARASGKLVWPQLVDNGIKPAILLVMVVVVVMLQLADARRLLLVYLIAQACAGIFLLKGHPFKFSTAARRKLHADEFNCWLSAAPGLIVASLMSTIVNQGDILVIGGVGSPSEVAVYKVAVQLAALCSIGVGLVNFIYAPRIAAAYRSRNFFELKTLTLKSAALTGSSATVCAIALLGLGYPLIPAVFGAEYSESYPVMCVLVAARVVDGVFGPVTSIANMAGKQGYVVLAMATAAAVIAIGGLLVWKQHGTLGIAVVSGLAMVAWNVMLFALLVRDLMRSTG